MNQGENLKFFKEMASVYVLPELLFRKSTRSIYARNARLDIDNIFPLNICHTLICRQYQVFRHFHLHFQQVFFLDFTLVHNELI